MNLALVFDLAILLLLVVFAIRGASRGLVLSLCGLVAVLLAFLGGRFVADAGAPVVARYLEPQFAASIERNLEQQIEQTPWTSAPEPDAALPSPDQHPLEDVLEVLKEMGLYQELIATIEKAVAAGMTEAAAGAAAAVAAAIAQSVAYMLIFLVTFVLILVLWTILSHALDLVTRLPGLNFLNRTGGAVLGLLKCCIFLFLCAWVLRYSGTLVPEETVAKTYLLKFFLTTNPIDLILGL